MGSASNPTSKGNHGSLLPALHTSRHGSRGQGWPSDELPAVREAVSGAVARAAAERTEAAGGARAGTGNEIQRRRAAAEVVVVRRGRYADAGGNTASG